MRNLIKEYIKTGKTFADLQEEYGIMSNERNGLICLSYSQIESPKLDPLVRQCRGLIIDKNTLDIVHYPFYRFYNIDEEPSENIKFNWNKIIGLEKIDGSLFGITYYKNEWIISTRTAIGGLNNVSSGLMNFYEMFKLAIGMDPENFFNYLNKDIDYTFEICGPENTIITPYDKAKLYLICARDKKDNFRELIIDSVANDIYEKANNDTLFFLPAVFNLIENEKFIGFEAMKNIANNLPNNTDEGFVIVDYSSYNSEFGYYPRMKVKNNEYINLHHLRGTLNNGQLNYPGIFETIIKGEQDEVLANYPSFKQYFDQVEEKYNNFLNKFNVQYEAVKPFFELPIEDRTLPEVKRDFALNIDKRYSVLLFPMFNKNMTLVEYIEFCANSHPNYYKQFYKQFIV